MRILRRCLPLCALLLLATADARADTQCSTAAQPGVWQCWEKSLTSQQPSADPYRDVKLKIRFTRANQTTFESYAFWNGPGAGDFKFRVAFPTTSTAASPWRWTAVCETASTCGTATGLNGMTGTVVVNAYSGSNQLYKHGFLKTAGHALVQADGTPFLWLGDTAWGAPIQATAGDWDSYLTNAARSRKKMGFTVIQVATPVDWMKTAGQQPTDVNNQAPFNDCTTDKQIPDSSCHLNPPFWRDFAKKVQSANDQGFVVLIVGLMDPFIETTSAGMTAYPDINESKTFVRTLVAQLAGNFVIFSPGFDRDTGDNAIRNRIIQVGGEILNASHFGTSSFTPRHLITNHPAGSNQVAQITNLQNQGWLSFQMYQSGQAARLAQESICSFNACTSAQENDILAAQLRLITQRPRDMAAQISKATPVKPVVNGEAIYEGFHGSCRLCPTLNLCGPGGSTCPLGTSKNYERHYNADRARQAAYLSFLAGGDGYTLGTKDIVNWIDWSSGLGRSSADHMKQLRAILLNVNWSSLVSADTKIQNQPAEEDRKMAVAEVPELNAAVAYLPDSGNDRIQLNVTTWPNFETWSTKLWFNPRNGSQPTAVTAATGSCSSVAAGRMCCTGPATARSCTFVKPAGGDWALVLRKSSSAPVVGVPALMAWVGLDPESDAPTVFAQLQGSDGSLVGDPFQVSDSDDLADKVKPRVAREPGGVYMVVWESDGADSASAEIQARRVSASGGLYKEGLLRVDKGSVTRQADPEVAATPAGGFVVAWTSGDGETGLSDIRARQFDADGEGLEEVLVTSTSGTHNNPLVVTDSSGDFAVVWEQSIGETAGPGAVMARLFNGNGTAAGAEFPTAMILTDDLGNPLTTNALVSAEFSEANGLAVTWGLTDTAETLLGIYEQSFTASGFPTNDLLTVWSPPGGGNPEM